MDESALDVVHESLDCLALHGSGSSPAMLQKAGIDKAEMIIAVTDSDEVNTVACLLAAQMAPGIKRIARIRGEEYTAAIGVDFAINPEREAADRILGLCKVNEARDIVEFADGRVRLIGVKIREGSPVAGLPLMDLREQNPDQNILFAAISRGEKVIVPRGRTQVRVGDVLYVVAPTEQVSEALSITGVIGDPSRRVMIYGGTHIGRYIATDLQAAGVKVKLIEEDPRLAAELAVDLDRSVVLRGSGADRELLMSENVGDMDTFIAVSRDENTNILVSLLAKHLGARRVIALTDNLAFIPIVTLIGVDVAVSPRLSAVSSILQFVRKGNVQHVTSIHAEDAEALDVIALETSDIVGKPLKKVHFPRGAIVGAVEHAGQTFIPDGDTVVHPGDRVFIFSLREATPKVENILTVKLEYF